MAQVVIVDCMFENKNEVILLKHWVENWEHLVLKWKFTWLTKLFVITYSSGKMEAFQETTRPHPHMHVHLKDKKERKTIYLTEKGELVIW